MFDYPLDSRRSGFQLFKILKKHGIYPKSNLLHGKHVTSDSSPLQGRRGLARGIRLEVPRFNPQPNELVPAKNAVATQHFFVFDFRLLTESIP